MLLEIDGMCKKKEGGLNGNDDLQVRTVDDKIVKEKEKCYTYEEAIDLAGSGRYNVWLLCVLSLTIVSMGVDMFGLGVVVVGCTCDFNLTLAQKGILSSVPFAGSVVMAYPWGYLSDTRGRRACLLVAMSGCFVASTLSSFSPNWIVMAILKLIGTSLFREIAVSWYTILMSLKNLACIPFLKNKTLMYFTLKSCPKYIYECSSAQSVTYSLLGECCGRKTRGLYIQIMTSVLMTGIIWYCVLGYFMLKLDFSYDMGFWDMNFKPWRLLNLTMALPLGIAALGLAYCYESPKFLVNQGKTEESLRILQKLYEINGGNPGDFPVRNLILEEQGNASPTNNEPLLQSIWNQTAPLFRPPLLLRTLQLYYLTAIIYGINNSYLMWYPIITNAFFSSYWKQDSNIAGLCQLINDGLNSTSVVSSLNATSDSISTPCIDYLEDLTAFSGIFYGVLFTGLNLVIAKLVKWKKAIMITVLLASTVGGLTTNLTPEPISALMLFMLLLITALGVGVIFTYYVDLYPTSYRGMVACLAVMVGRGSSLIGINIVGAVIANHCTASFYACSAFVFSGVIVAWFLPPDKPSQKKP